MLHLVQQKVVLIVGGDIQGDILIGKNEKRIQEHPPHQQHEKIQRAEVESLFLLELVRTPGYSRDHRYEVEEQNDVREIGIRDILVQKHFAIHPSSLVKRPADQARCH